MKRLLLLALITVIGVIKISAQEIDMSQENSTDARIEKLSQEVVELSQKLEKLQEDYEYLAFIYDLESLLNKMKTFNNEVKVETNEIVVLCYNGSFDIDQYLLKDDTYEHFQDMYELYLYKKDDFVKQKSNLIFSSEKLSHINSLYKFLDVAQLQIAHSLKAYKAYLNVYKQKSELY